MKEFVALSYLRRSPGIGRRELGERLMLDANNTVLLLNELEVRDLAERRRHPEDRRRHVVEITAQGVRALERAERAVDSLEDDVLRGLSARERATLRELLLRGARGRSPRAVAATPYSSTCPETQVTVPPPTQIVPSGSRSTCTRPARPSAVPWLAT